MRDKLAIILVGLMLSVAVARADDRMRDAKRHVEAADIAYRLGRFSEALDHYTQAFELYPVPPLLFNIGQCEKNLKDYAKAIFFFEGYLRDDPTAANRALVEDLIRESRAQLAATVPDRGREPTATSPPDGSPPDGSPASGSPADGSPPDGSPASGSPPDGSPADGAPADGAPADGATPGGSPPSGSPPSGSPPSGSPPSGSPPSGSPPVASPSEAVQPSMVRATASPPVRGPARSRLVPGLLIGAGFATLHVGGALFYYGQLRGPNDKYIYDDTRWLGGAVMLAGAAVLTTGAVLWVHGRSHAPVAALGPSGGYVGWAGAF